MTRTLCNSWLLHADQTGSGTPAVQPKDLLLHQVCSREQLSASASMHPAASKNPVSSTRAAQQAPAVVDCVQQQDTRCVISVASGQAPPSPGCRTEAHSINRLSSLVFHRLDLIVRPLVGNRYGLVLSSAVWHHLCRGIDTTRLRVLCTSSVPDGACRRTAFLAAVEHIRYVYMLGIQVPPILLYFAWVGIANNEGFSTRLQLARRSS